MAEGLNQPARSRRYLSLLSNTDAPLCLRRTRCGLEPAMADDPRRERQGQVGAAGLRSVATFGDVDGDARQYEGDQLAPISPVVIDYFADRPRPDRLDDRAGRNPLGRPINERSIAFKWSCPRDSSTTKPRSRAPASRAPAESNSTCLKGIARWRRSNRPPRGLPPDLAPGTRPLGLAAARLEFAAYRASIQVFDPTSFTATFEKKRCSGSPLRVPR